MKKADAFWKDLKDLFERLNNLPDMAQLIGVWTEFK